MYEKPEGWTAPIRKTWKELKTLAVIKVAVIRKKMRRVSVLKEHTSYVRPMRHITVGRKCSAGKLTNHQRMVVNRK